MKTSASSRRNRLETLPDLAPAQQQVSDLLAADGVEPIPYIVLSIEDLDSVLRLVEIGNTLDELVFKMVSESANRPLALFHGELEEIAVSSFSFQKAKEFLDGILS